MARFREGRIRASRVLGESWRIAPALSQHPGGSNSPSRKGAILRSSDALGSLLPDKLPTP
eukprot:9204040-Alexandrium_andersonii.AAC.1